MDKSISHKLSEFAHNLKFKQIPTEVIAKAKLHILDTMGIMMATHNFNGVKRVVHVVKRLGGPPESKVIGHNFRVVAPNAVLANAAMAHSVDYDDTHLATIHPSCILVPTAFAVGETANSSGKDILEAIIAAYEVSIRLGLVCPRFHHRGFHPTPIIGVFGAVVAAGKLLGLSVEQFSWALGIAGSMSSGISQAVEEGVWVKPMHPAFAAHSGIIASLLAKEECNGPLQVFEGRLGFFNAYLRGEKLRLEEATKELGERWETLKISLKPYPTCHATHSCIDLARIFKEKYKIEPEMIQECMCYLPKFSLDLVFPRDEKLLPATPYGAKFNIPYCVAVTLRKGNVGLWDFTEEAIKDHETLRLLSKIKGSHDEKYDRYMGVVPARARIKTKDGSIYEEEVINHKGTPKNPLTKDEVIDKFMDNLKLTKYNEIANEIVKKTLSIEKYTINEITEML